MSDTPESPESVPSVSSLPIRNPSQSDEDTTPELSQSDDSSTEPSIHIGTGQPTQESEGTCGTSPSEGDTTTAPTPSDETKTTEPSTSAADTTPDASSVEELKKDDPLTDTEGINPNTIEDAMLRARHPRGKHNIAEPQLPVDGLEDLEEDNPPPLPPAGEGGGGPPAPAGGGGGRPPGMFRYVPGIDGLEEVANSGAEQMESSNSFTCKTWHIMLAILIFVIIIAIVVLIIVYFTYPKEKVLGETFEDRGSRRNGSSIIPLLRPYK